VDEGEILLKLDSTDSETQLATIENEINILETEAIRIDKLTQIIDKMAIAQLDVESTASFAQIYWGPLDHSHPVFVKQAALLDAEIEELAAFQKEVEAQILVNQRLEEVTFENLSSAESLVLTSRERMSAAEQLFDRKLISRMSFLDVKDSFSQSVERQRLSQKELEYKQANLSAIEAQYNKEVASRKRDLMRRSTDIDAELTNLMQARIATTRRVENSELRAPIGGVVEQLQLKTIGGIIQTGEELMQIVPSNQRMEIEAIIGNAEIGFLSVGQKVNIKLDAFPPEIYGGVSGEVISIAYNSIQVDSGNWGYVVRVRPQKEALTFGNQSLELKPGMTTKIDVITGKRSIISYFFAPIIKVIQNSLGEQ
jgi:hemolysin D